MTHDINFFEQIEDYCLELLNPHATLEFETELTTNPELRTEVSLWKDIQNALAEKEILALREKLRNVTSTSMGELNNSFDILHDFAEIEDLNETMSPQDLINYFDSLPKVHAHHHETLAIEHVHAYYRKQNGHGTNKINDESFDFDLAEFEGLEDAILEKDILQLRQTLGKVAKSVEPQYSAEDIDNYLSDELVGSELIDFERDLIFNKALQNEVQLHREIDSALFENDILGLRNKIANILKSETSWNVSENSIEDFIDGVLEEDLLAEFNAELNDNSDLIAEVELRRQVNAAIGEKAIMELRAELNFAREAADSKKVEMLIPATKKVYLNYWKTGVAVIVLLLGITGVLRNGAVSVDKTYNNFYEIPSWAPERSVMNEVSFMQEANALYSNGEYAALITKFESNTNLVKGNPVLGFYQAASYQNLNRMNEAIEAYSGVINHGDNLFIEEAEWYRSLCYLKKGDKKMAKNELLAVIDRKGHFEKDAKAVLRKLKYKLK